MGLMVLGTGLAINILSLTGHVDLDIFIQVFHAKNVKFNLNLSDSISEKPLTSFGRKPVSSSVVLLHG